ncbi:MAG TPA: thioredoxin [Pyrinomonadaceae bacterium]|nr:thioredoxin [Pyrinomonadaceae bacterium]
MQVVVCNKCGSKNRVDPASAAGQIAKCGRCGTPLEVDSKAPGNIPLIVRDDTFSKDVLQTRGTVLLDCWAPWCGPCRIVGPIMEQLAAESNGRYRIAKLNVDENPRTASQFQIQSIPTMLIFKDGKLVDRLVGALPKPAIADRLQAHAG